MRSGQYIRALGRQSFEPSVRESHSTSSMPPSEHSQERQRALIKAQNDVLATVGVCLRDTKSSLEKSEQLMAENEAGLVVGALDLTVTYLASWPLVGIRNRLQTYRRYRGLRYRDVMWSAWRGERGRLFAGMPAHLSYQVLNLTRDYAQARFFVWLSSLPLFMESGTKKPQNRWLLRFAGRCVSFASWFLIYPLYYHSNLQTLHLLPHTPLLPPLTSFLPFSPTSPIHLPYLPPNAPLLSLTTLSSLTTQAASSFFLHSFALQSISITLQYILFKRLLALLPTPTTATATTTSASASVDPDDQLYVDPEPPAHAAQPARQHYRATTLSSHPVDVVASHMADCIAGSVMLVAETMVMRCLARGVLQERGLGANVLGRLVYGVVERGGEGIVARAMVVGEWGLMWVLFECTWVVSTAVGMRWFGYGAK